MIDDNNITFGRTFRRSQDLPFTYECMLCAQAFYYFGEERLYHSRPVGTSLSRGYTQNMWQLYISLIERLYSDTEKFSELNLMDQMHLRAFFSVTDAIENEFKPTCKNNRKTKIRIIKEIMKHPICDRFKGHIPVDELNELLRNYYICIEKKTPEKLIRCYERYKFKKNLTENKIKPVVRKIVAGKVSGKIYRTLRGK